MSVKKKLLLVEDETFTATLLKRNLELVGYEVGQPLATGMDAVEAVRKDSFDAILMDIRLVGEMDGIEAALRIKAIKDIPIIFLTGYFDEEIIERAKSIEPVAYLVKPVTPKEIIPLLNKIFG